MAIADGKQDIKSIFADDRYFEIPNYQRSYAWREKQLRDFLEDFSHVENYKKYYYGTILLQHKENTDDTYEIVDGQQRLTTLIIFMSCLIKRMEEVGLTDEAGDLVKKFIKYKINYVLKLQDQDDGFFKMYILSPNEKADHKTPAQRNLWEAKDYFAKALKNADKDECMQYRTRILAANCLVYSVNDRNEAAMIFETTNDRGKILTNLEKTKSFLMYKVSSSFKDAHSLLGTIEQGFNDIYATYENLRGKPKFNLDESSIQQYMFIAYETWKNKKVDGKTYKAYQHYMGELKERVNHMVKDIAEAKEDREKYELIFNKYIETYIKNLKESFAAVSGMYGTKGKFKNLLTLGRMASIWPLLIKAFWLDKSDDKTMFNELCHWCEIFCFRGLAMQKYLSNKYDSRWYDIANGFKGDFSKLFYEIKKMIISLGDDEKFLDRVTSKDFYKDYSPADRNYLFWSYENYLRDQKGYARLSFDDLWQTDSKKKLTIEHIVAQSGEKDKNRILMDERNTKIGGRVAFDREYLHSIGNLAIDPKSANSAKGKKEVEEKNSKYFIKAPLMSQNELDGFMEGGKWTINSINKRKDALISFIKATWCFPFSEAVIDIADEQDVEEIKVED